MMDLEIFKQYGGSTPAFSLNDKKTWARVVSIYDGDTLTAVIPVLGSFFKFKIRLQGIDTCEMKSATEFAKDMALKARNRLVEVITGTSTPFKTKKDIEKYLDSNVCLVWLHCLEMDKYGRVLANVYRTQDEMSINQLLLDEKLAYSYNGDTKKTEQEQIEYLNN